MLRCVMITPFGSAAPDEDDPAIVFGHRDGCGRSRDVQSSSDRRHTSMPARAAGSTSSPTSTTRAYARADAPEKRGRRAVVDGHGDRAGDERPNAAIHSGRFRPEHDDRLWRRRRAEAAPRTLGCRDDVLRIPAGDIRRRHEKLPRADARSAKKSRSVSCCDEEL
jgi:hypothetical protein